MFFPQVQGGKYFINHLPLFRFPVYYFSVIPPLKAIASIDFHPFIQCTSHCSSKFWLELAPHPRTFHQLFSHLIQFTASPLKAWPYLFIPLFISVLTWGCLMSRSSSYFLLMMTLSFQVKLLLGTHRQSIYFILFFPFPESWRWAFSGLSPFTLQDLGSLRVICIGFLFFTFEEILHKSYISAKFEGFTLLLILQIAF